MVHQKIYVASLKIPNFPLISMCFCALILIWLPKVQLNMMEKYALGWFSSNPYYWLANKCIHLLSHLSL